MSQDLHSAPAEAGDRPGLGPATAGLLLAMFQEAYRQELGAEEDVHRTLPFFATALGLMIAAVSYAAGQLPSWSTVTAACPQAARAPFSLHAVGCAWPETAAVALLLSALVLGVGVLWLLAPATQRRRYERVGPESAHLARAEALQAFHAGCGLSGDALDAAVAQDLRMQLAADYATVLPHNRQLNMRRYAWRAWAVSWLLWSLLSAIAATTLVIGAAKFGRVAHGSP